MLDVCVWTASVDWTLEGVYMGEEFGNVCVLVEEFDRPEVTLRG